MSPEQDAQVAVGKIWDIIEDYSRLRYQPNQNLETIEKIAAIINAPVSPRKSVVAAFRRHHQVEAKTASGERYLHNGIFESEREADELVAAVIDSGIINTTFWTKVGAG